MIKIFVIDFMSKGANIKKNINLFLCK